MADDRPLRDLLVAWDELAIRWGLADDERGALLPAGLLGPVRSVPSWRVDGAERRIRLLVRLDVLLRRVQPEPGRARGWLRRSNATLAGLTPLEAMAESATWIEWLSRSLEAAS